jgi:DNA-binding NarL/FixJ family response regulator
MAQTRVLGLLAEGKTNREIAELLGLTEGTVKIHLSAIYRALKVSSRAQALVVIRRGHA